MTWTNAPDGQATATVLYRCCRQCEAAAGRKVAKRVSYAVRWWRGSPDRWGYRPVTRREYIAPDGSEHRGFPPSVACTLCGRSMAGRIIEGYRKPGVPCDARCTGAVGHHCECSCGGKNHGADHG